MKALRPFTLFSLLLAGLFVSGLVQAQTYYPDRATFDAANPGLATEDFEAGTIPTPPVCPFDGPVGSAGAPPCFAAGALLPGASYNSSGIASPNMVLIDTGFIPSASKVIGANFFAESTFITFTEPTNTAVAFDLYCAFVPVGNATIVISGASGLIDTQVSSCTETPAFFGVSAAETITQIEIIADSDAGELVDNVSYAAAPVAPPAARATFSVTKDFSDNNTAEVQVQISCNTGLPLEQSFTISDSQSEPGGSFVPSQPGVNFVVTDYADGAMDCTITETPVSGYTPLYQASGSSTAVDDDPDNPGCNFSSINHGDANSCIVGNTLDPVAFTITKEWEFRDGQADFPEMVYIDITCENLRFTPFTDVEPVGEFRVELNTAFPSVTAPPIFPNFTTPLTRCNAIETDLPSGTESDQGCAEWQEVTIGGGPISCTITNTAFYEGIPTLSQYGLAILVLLTLGIGMVGMRRMI